MMRVGNFRPHVLLQKNGDYFPHISWIMSDLVALHLFKGLDVRDFKDHIHSSPGYNKPTRGFWGSEVCGLSTHQPHWPRLTAWPVTPPPPPTPMGLLTLNPIRQHYQLSKPTCDTEPTERMEIINDIPEVISWVYHATLVHFKAVMEIAKIVTGDIAISKIRQETLGTPTNPRGPVSALT